MVVVAVVVEDVFVFVVVVHQYRYHRYDVDVDPEDDVGSSVVGTTWCYVLVVDDVVVLDRWFVLFCVCFD